MLSLIKILGFSFTICFFMNCHSTVIIHKENSKPLSSIYAPPPPEKEINNQILFSESIPYQIAKKLHVRITLEK
ncbi:hypothetical protein LEP1GSC037_3708 [Leptospira interrogans str. 2006001854]|uniref:Uncharacterized protein n=1 Tax=Leptospira interrogans str. 2006001854 TaxID=1001590 RepID=M6GG36_LEPIR|nr:hypothetical protein LEP1GSC037_3708 [Leptospira interrogans str. 2006001854]